MTNPTFNDLKKNLKKDFSKFKKVKVAILSDSASQLLSQAFRGYGYLQKFNFKIFEAEYDQIDRQILDQSSDLYKFNPEIIIIFESSQKLVKDYYGLQKKDKLRFIKNHSLLVRNYCKVISKKLSSKIIYFNIAELDDSVFGSLKSKVVTAAPLQFKKLNVELSRLSQELNNLYILDFDALVRRYGATFCFDAKLYVNTSMVVSLDFLPIVARRLVDIIAAVNGQIKKCVILDLDNTLWGGIIGDDGLENIQIGELGIGKAFSSLQLWLKQLSERGIILVIASKNDERIAKEPFIKHPDMVLKLSDVALFVANWNSKIDNVAYIQKTLNIGFDSIVFLDDNPFEREMVAKTFRQITAPDLPEDPSEWLTFLQDLNLFEMASFSTEDNKRTKQYQQASRRVGFQSSFSNEDEFLRNLKMVAKVAPFGIFDIPRVAQLTQRSNQFNLRTIRYSEDEIKVVAKSKNHLTLSIHLKDKFGDMGLISLAILEKRRDHLFVDTWIMSCRVLRRGVEDLVLKHMVDIAKKNKYKSLIGEYVKTAKNALVANHYQKLGFVKRKNLWHLALDEYKAKTNYIKVNNG